MLYRIAQVTVTSPNKYVVVELPMHYPNAQAYCEENVGTDLASIHSDADNDEALSLCASHDCWIGLDRLGDGEWAWRDDSALDYGSNRSEGDPWADTDASSDRVGEDCVQLRHDDLGLWHVVFCGEMERFLCNVENQLCADQYWLFEGDVRWGGADMCETYSHADSLSRIADKVWSIENLVQLTIEFKFTVHDLSAVASDDSFAGVVLYAFDTPSDYYFVGLSANEFAFTKIVFCKFSEGVVADVVFESDLFPLDIDNLYTLHVDVMRYFSLNSLDFEVSLDDYDGHNVTFTDDDLSVSSSTYIGLKNERCNVSGAQLSVWPIGEYTNLTRQPTPWPSEPTLEPTLTTSDPTGDPTEDPTAPPTTKPSVSPTYDPTRDPTADPSEITSAQPTLNPSPEPSQTPSRDPTTHPTVLPTQGMLSVHCEPHAHAQPAHRADERAKHVRPDEASDARYNVCVSG